MWEQTHIHVPLIKDNDGSFQPFRNIHVPCTVALKRNTKWTDKIKIEWARRESITAKKVVINCNTGEPDKVDKIFQLPSLVTRSSDSRTISFAQHWKL